MLAVYGLALALGISFTSVLANFISFALAYFAFSYVITANQNAPLKRLLSWPLLPGYTLGTVGCLGLLFMVGEYLNPPKETQTLAANLSCRTTTWGMAGSSSGYDVHVYQTWEMLPFLERELGNARVDETALSPGDWLGYASCEAILAQSGHGG